METRHSGDKSNTHAAAVGEVHQEQEEPSTTDENKTEAADDGARTNAKRRIERHRIEHHRAERPRIPRHRVEHPRRGGEAECDQGKEEKREEEAASHCDMMNPETASTSSRPAATSNTKKKKKKKQQAASTNVGTQRSNAESHGRHHHRHHKQEQRQGEEAKQEEEASSGMVHPHTACTSATTTSNTKTKKKKQQAKSTHSNTQRSHGSSRGEHHHRHHEERHHQGTKDNLEASSCGMVHPDAAHTKKSKRHHEVSSNRATQSPHRHQKENHQVQGGKEELETVSSDLVLPDTTRSSVATAANTSSGACHPVEVKKNKKRHGGPHHHVQHGEGPHRHRKENHQVQGANEELESVSSELVLADTTRSSVATAANTSSGAYCPIEVTKKIKKHHAGPHHVQHHREGQEQHHHHREDQDRASNSSVMSVGAARPTAATGDIAIGENVMEQHESVALMQAAEVEDAAPHSDHQPHCDGTVVQDVPNSSTQSSQADADVGAFAVHGEETTRREADTSTAVSGLESSTVDNLSVQIQPPQNDENRSEALLEAELVRSAEDRDPMQQLMQWIQTQQQQQMNIPLAQAEIAPATQAVDHDTNNEMSSPAEAEEPSNGIHTKVTRTCMKNRRVAVGLVILLAAVVVAVAIPLANSNKSASPNKGAAVVSNNSTSPPSTSSPSSEETSIAPTAADTKAPVATSPATANPSEAPTRLPTSAPTSPPTTQLPSLDPTTTMSPMGRPWLPVGQELGGKAEKDCFGRSISLSRDARVLAVGADQCCDAGYVSIFESDDSTGSWVAKGQELVGEANGDNFGRSVALNGDGTILAVGDYWNDNGGGDGAGHVRVFQHNTNTNRWVQLGSDIDGEAEYDHFGYSVSLSKSGDILAAGALYGSYSWGGQSGGGSVRMFQHDRGNNSWEPLGQTLVGQVESDFFGVSVCLSSSGEFVAVGAPRNGSGGIFVGQVSMFQYNSASSKWDPLGSPINGQVVNGRFGHSVSLDDSGLVVAVGAPGNDHAFEDERVLVYAYDGAMSEWVKRGKTVESQQVRNNFGEAVSLSKNGNVLAVGSTGNDANGLRNSGQVTIFQYNTNTMEWDAVGEPLNGKAVWDYFGGSVSLSEDGTVVAVGATGHDSNGIEDAGSVSVYTLN